MHPYFDDLFTLPKGSSLEKWVIKSVRSWSPEKALITLAPWAHYTYNWVPKPHLGTGHKLLPAHFSKVLTPPELDVVSKKPFDLLVTSRQIAQLAKAICILSRGDSVPTGREIVMVSLAIEQLIKPAFEESTKDDSDMIAIVRNAERIPSESLSIAWNRYNKLLYGNIADKFGISPYRNNIEKKIGLQLNKLVAFFMAALVKSFEDFKRNSLGLISLSPLAVPAVDASIVYNFINTSSSKISDFRLPDSKLEEFDFVNLTDLRCFRVKPLIQIDDYVLVCPWLLALIEGFNHNLYWICLHHLEEGERDKFCEKLGDAFAEYLVQLWKNRNDLVTVPEFIYKRNFKSPDLFLLPGPGTSLVAVEAKTSRYAADQYLRGTGERIEKTTEDVIVKGFDQLSKRLKEFQEGHYFVNGLSFDMFRAIYPVVCTFTPMHVGFKYWDNVKSILKNRSLFVYSTVIKRPRLVSVEEMECLFQLKRPPWRILKEWSKSDMGDSPFDYYEIEHLKGAARNKAWKEKIQKDVPEILGAELGLGPRAQKENN